MLDHNFATDITRTIKHLRTFINFVTFFIPSLDVLKDKRTIIEKQSLNTENKTNNNHPNQQLKKSLKTFSGTIRIYLINELPIPPSFHINQIVETNLNLHIKNTLPDNIPLHMTYIIVKIQIRCTKLALYFLLQTTTNNEHVEKLQDDVYELTQKLYRIF